MAKVYIYNIDLQLLFPDESINSFFTKFSFRTYVISLLKKMIENKEYRSFLKKRLLPYSVLKWMDIEYKISYYPKGLDSTKKERLKETVVSDINECIFLLSTVRLDVLTEVLLPLVPVNELSSFERDICLLEGYVVYLTKNTGLKYLGKLLPPKKDLTNCYKMFLDFFFAEQRKSIEEKAETAVQEKHAETKKDEEESSEVVKEILEKFPNAEVKEVKIEDLKKLKDKFNF